MMLPLSGHLEDTAASVFHVERSPLPAVLVEKVRRDARPPLARGLRSARRQLPRSAEQAASRLSERLMAVFLGDKWMLRIAVLQPCFELINPHCGESPDTIIPTPIRK